MTSVQRRLYDGQVDCFLVYLPEDDSIYVVPIEDLADGLSHLRVVPPRNAARRNINWASDYLLGVGERANAVLPAPSQLRLEAAPE